jgi:hypothetical protein
MEYGHEDAVADDRAKVMLANEVSSEMRTREATMIPSQAEIEIPILEALAALAGQAQPSAVPTTDPRRLNR